MRLDILLSWALCLQIALFLPACSPKQSAVMKKAASVQEAIEFSQSLDKVSWKTNYLIGQAKAFYQAKDYRASAIISRYILDNIDSDNRQAKIGRAHV